MDFQCAGEQYNERFATFLRLQSESAVSAGRKSALSIRPGLLFHPGGSPSQALSKLTLIHWEYVQSIKAENNVDFLLAKTCSRQNMLPAGCSLLFLLFLLEFVQHCYKGIWLCQGVYDTNNLPEPPHIGGLSIAKVTILVFLQFKLRQEGQRGNPYLFCRQ